MNENIYIILVRPQYPINIGMICRTMKNFDFNNLIIVDPMCNIYSELTLRLSHNARDILYNAEIYSDLRSAIGNKNIIISATARKRKYHNPYIKINEFSNNIFKLINNNKIAFVFGNEETGLTNEEMKYSHYLLRIPASKSFPALNLAQAIAIVLYELFTISEKYIAEENSPQLAKVEELLGLFDHIHEYYDKIGFFKEEDHSRMMSTIIRIFQKANLTSRETRILRGMIRQSEWYMKNNID